MVLQAAKWHVYRGVLTSGVQTREVPLNNVMLQLIVSTQAPCCSCALHSGMDLMGGGCFMEGIIEWESRDSNGLRLPRLAAMSLRGKPCMLGTMAGHLSPAHMYVYVT